MELLRTTLQPITHNLPDPLRAFATSLIGPKCYQTLLLDIDPTDTACLTLALSKGLGIGIVAASSIVKVPQILKLVNSQSASGVSFLSYLLETVAYLISLAYNVRKGFPFSTYGETALILAQNVVIAVLVLGYSGRKGLAASFVAGIAGAGAALFGVGGSEVVDMDLLAMLQAGAGTLGVASKVPQIVAIWQEGGTGQLSAFTVFNYLVGSLVRIFTTLKEVPDQLILYGFVAGFILNAVIAAQMMFYWNAPSSKAKGKRREVPVGAAPSSGVSTGATKGRTITRRKA